MRRQASLDLEALEASRSGGAVAGVDEAGRGPWAGPVVAAAVILDFENVPSGLADSKALSEAAREAAYREIVDRARVGLGVADVARIDRDNILQATLWAMQTAIAALPEVPRVALIDGNRAPRLACEARCVVGGDARCLSIAAASIVAKVTRDRLMVALGVDWPGYGFESHKGYGTPDHRKALARLGVTPHHRRSFRPVQLALQLRQTSVA